MAKKVSWYTIIEGQVKGYHFGVDAETVEGYYVSKTDEAGEPLDTYYVNRNGTKCTCPARVPFCRHKQMLVKFKELDRIGKGYQYCHDRDEWKEPKKELGGLYADMDDDDMSKSKPESKEPFIQQE